ncbi:hypothetical protein [Clostridium sp.]|uniref:hypothetical protein n=1 Tax=Clostridium sp. TaxID=1506 RepID=UPI001A4DD5E6|nr:hypothetical protein [Clostridium sp.]MBK5236533.1 hypothetical protein [Clostridium sp.]
MEKKYKYVLEGVLQNLRSIDGPNSADEYIDDSIKIIVEVLKEKNKEEKGEGFEHENKINKFID